MKRDVLKYTAYTKKAGADMKIEFGYDNRMETVEAPDANVIGILEPNELKLPEMSEDEMVRLAIASPIGSPRLKDIVRRGEKIVIVTSDISRPMPTWKVMPALLDELYAAGCEAGDITLVFARGVHRAQTDAEREHLAGERAYREIRCIDSDPDDVEFIGTTSSGTPVEIMRAVVEADRRICLGNIEFHYFAGYSGGYKAIMPGVSTRAAIQMNHRHMVESEAYAGHLEGNPVRDDIEEAGRMVGVDFILNVVLDAHKNIIRAVAGDVVKAHREGCEFLAGLYLKKIDSRADIVLVSQGGAPKDANLYQTQKALDNAKHAVRDGGIIILIGCCKEGYGEKTFETWFREANMPKDIIDRLNAKFMLGGHKAAAIALVEQHASIYLVSDWSEEETQKVFMKKFASAQSALDAALSTLGRDATIIAMPYGGSTLPKVK
ncbi:MAG: nickel-dependent lactate racemase [Oscillospiraceae bacterium]|nr:nickel-dependent lactate racemase [Oscillospiraceae bacterium]